MQQSITPGQICDVQAEYENHNVSEILDLLDAELIGLKPVKQRIREISALLIIENCRRTFELVTPRTGLHMSFTGAPGTGKTAIAIKMANILFRLGYIKKGQLLTVSRDDLVGQYIGHTAPKTKEVLKKAMGGVLFIDEAYYLYKPDNERDYGSESIEILLQVMENQREDLVVILAGYKEPMDEFYKSNPGLASRITNHVHFPDFTQEELLQIGSKFADELQYELTQEARDAFYQYIGLRMQKPLFANARSIRNALDRARMRHANRIFYNYRDQIVTKRDLVTLEASDFTDSRVFSS